MCLFDWNILLWKHDKHAHNQKMRIEGGWLATTPPPPPPGSAPEITVTRFTPVLTFNAAHFSKDKLRLGPSHATNFFVTRRIEEDVNVEGESYK